MINKENGERKIAALQSSFRRPFFFTKLNLIDLSDFY